ncbi:hypothetical protein Arub01_41150 [Actinomadura rubrobrunea]|uniref:Uncharacterized protein n=1 Tax=Actinomadura rubrobrunea TaxID=115335 RepID=A0A9W6PZN5_9ACTN|nr:hypothetical protein [Actinomadura rubrobrunea]GLW65871.1 hypothetical protein Arub01_41150 [Actinomadura rubrobrunea]
MDGIAGRLRPVTDVSPAAWLEEEVAETRPLVGALLPSRFAACARVLHPAESPEGEPVRWREVADWAGGVVHPRVQFTALASLRRGTRDDPAPWDEPPVRGDLPAPLLSALCEVLARHTSQAHDCLFCLWEGWGWIQGPPAAAVLQAGKGAAPGDPPEPAGFPREVLDGPRVRLPFRDYLLLRGPLEDATRIGDRGPGWFFPQSPNLFWPADRAWCVATDIDLDSTYVAGSAALIAELLDDPRLETVRADFHDPIGETGDDVNAR